MTERKGGYLRPVTNPYVSANYANHRWGRTPPSTEPGTDYGTAYGSAVYASEDGIIAYVDHSTAGAEGRRIAVQHPDGQMTSSIHLSRIVVNSGQKVKRGQLIAYSGASAWGKEWGVGAHVHHTLFPTHAMIFGTTRTLDFQLQEGPDNDGALGIPAGVAKPSQAVRDRQNSLNRYRKALGLKTPPLVVDGLLGAKTIADIKSMQKVVGVTPDGIWGPKTNSAYNAWAKKQVEKGKPQIPIVYHKATTKDAASLGRGDAVKGLQKIANLYLRQKVDGVWGTNSNRGLQLFLNQNYGGSLPAWLRAKWGYVGNDQWGPKMKAALQRANAANLRQL
jgi:peptidoglycan hydrolase-like protein with peptidoglycan-binding domain